MNGIDKERFGAFLAVLRKEKGLTQRALAERLYVSDKAVSKWERNASLPEVTLLPALARLLGTDLNDLLAFQQEMTREEVSAFLETLHRTAGEGAWPLPSPWRRSSGSSSPGAACWR